MILPTRKQAGCVRLTLSDPQGWDELRPFRAGGGPFIGLDHSAMLDVLARSIVAAADRGFDVYASPYLHRGPRRKGNAVARRHVHADIDGPLEVNRVRALGAFAVASGSVTDDGGQRGHVYVRMTESVPLHVHEALCRALGDEVGGGYADASKTSDNDLLRPVGTLNYKTDPPRPVTWLLPPDEGGVRTWQPESLARLLRVPWPVHEPVEAVVSPSGEVSEDKVGGAHNGGVQARLVGLVRQVREAPRRQGNGRLNWAAAVAAAICTTERNAPDEAAVRASLVDAYAARPVPVGESTSSRRAGAEATVRSGWTWGATHPEEALRRVDEVRVQGDENGEDSNLSPGASWKQCDVRSTVVALLAGTVDRPKPTVGLLTLCADDAAGALFYSGRVNGVAGESGCGKTWTALLSAVQVIAGGASVLYLDLEDDATGVVARMLDLGADPEAVADLFAYVHPEERLSPAAWQTLNGLLEDLSPALVVVDSTGEGLALEGANPNADDEVARWFRLLPRRVARHRTRPCVVVLDHVVKADDGTGLWPIGSQRKRAAIDGSQFMQRLRTPFDKNSPGSAVLICAKDRHGHYRPGARVAELVINPGTDADGKPVVQADLIALGSGIVGASGAGRPFRPTVLMETVSRHLENHPGPADRTGRQIREAVKGKNETIRDALDLLVSERYVTTEAGSRGATVYTSYRPYREADEAGNRSTP